MATENDPIKKETPAEKPAQSAEAKPQETEKPAASGETKSTETGKSDSPPPSASDKLNDAAKSAGAIAGSLFTKAKGLADDAIKTAKSDGTKENLNNAAKTAGALAGKVFAKAKDAAADVKKELGNVNDLRKESFANSEAGTSKKDMAKGFWAKLSGKQKGILAGILAICVYFSYSVLFSGGSQGWNFLDGVCATQDYKFVTRCDNEALRGASFPEGTAKPSLLYLKYSSDAVTAVFVQPAQHKRENPSVDRPDKVMVNRASYQKGDEPNSLLLTVTIGKCEETSLFRKKGSTITEERVSQKGDCLKDAKAAFEFGKGEGPRKINVIDDKYVGTQQSQSTALQPQTARSKLPPCKGNDANQWNMCFGIKKSSNGHYEGEFKDGLMSGYGTDTNSDGLKRVGYFEDGYYMSADPAQKDKSQLIMPISEITIAGSCAAITSVLEDPKNFLQLRRNSRIANEWGWYTSQKYKMRFFYYKLSERAGSPGLTDLYNRAESYTQDLIPVSPWEDIKEAYKKCQAFIN